MAQYRLPQNDKDSKRASELEKWRRDFTFNHDKGYPLAEKYPLINIPGPEYQTKVVDSGLRRRSSLKSILDDSGLKFANSVSHISTSNLAKILVNRDITPIVNYFMSDLGPVLPHGLASSLDDYAKIFTKDALPESEKNVDSDEAFAYTYLAGSDPDVLKRMQQIPENFPINNTHFQSVPQLASDDLYLAMSEGRVYFVDYAIMKDLENGSHPQQPKYMFAPIAAFALPRSGGPLLPFAIQTGQDPQGRTIYTPKDKWSWKIARSTVQTATNAHSAIISHLSLTHIVMEPVALCLYRNLSPKHPVYALLQPHIENTLIINNSAFKTLVGPHQFVDRMLGSTIESNYGLIRSTRRNFDFKAQYLPTKLTRNKTMESTALSLYPYRDDGILIWNEIYRWVSRYLSYYYPTEQDLLMDQEIQAWAFEIGSETIGQVRGFASGTGVSSIEELIETITMIIFTAGPQHAALNFAQKSDMAYVPSAPMAGYAPEISGRDHNEKDWLKFLPPLDVAVVQLTLCYMLGSVYYGRLGDYGSIFNHSPVESILKDYQRNLKDIEATIENRNKARRPYLHLMPSRIPQSINI